MKRVSEDRMKRIKEIAERIGIYHSRMDEIVASVYEELSQHPEPLTDEQAQSISDKWDSGIGGWGPKDFINFIAAESQRVIFDTPDPDAGIRHLFVDHSDVYSGELVNNTAHEAERIGYERGLKEAAGNAPHR